MQNGHVVYSFLGQELHLLPQKAIFWKEQNALLVADVHLGKVGHFRKSGIAIPRSMEQNDLAVLSDLIEEHRPGKLYILGDFFHSDMNADWQWMSLWREQHKSVKITLVMGNHDVIEEKNYHEIGIETCLRCKEGPFMLMHHPVSHTDKLEGLYGLAGHIHPGVTFTGRGREYVTLPCFSFGKEQGILPSFGRFTGRVSLQYRESDHVFAVLKNHVFRVNRSA
ncbi:MAG: ligase-associated DNA damage response endonuclease PdeM [Mucilaginibacter polytrichastri]|nr:ligase-associated DNA damage response endonuclease PdeM [Mucilaginibacter polytrichastri]